MAGYKETPRQKMIGMMYLVLTALLALNVSVEILNAFMVVNDGMETTNRTYSSKISDYYSRFESAFTKDPVKVGPYWEKAKAVRKLSDDLKTYLVTVKYEAVAASERISIDSAKVRPLYKMKSKDKYNETTKYFIAKPEDGSSGKAKEMRDKITKYKTDLLNLLDPVDREKVKLGLDLEGPFYNSSRKKLNWQMYNFYHTILAANVTILNKLVNEVQNAELDVVTTLRGKIGESDFKISDVDAAVVPTSQYVFQGENYEAEVFVTAMDKMQTFTANIGGSFRTSQDGVIKVSLPATRPGPQSIKGIVNVKKPDGTIEARPVTFDYMVAPPTTTVSPTKMNVFYIDVDNPVSISAGGVSPDQILATCNNGTIIRNGSSWIVRPAKPGKALITVSAKVGDRIKSLGTPIEFRVKTVPDPTAKIGGISDGPILKQKLLASYVKAVMPDFDFALTYDVTSFTLVPFGKGDDYQPLKSNNSQLTSEMKALIQDAKPRQKFMIREIMAKGPSGTPVKLNVIIITVQ